MRRGIVAVLVLLAVCALISLETCDRDPVDAPEEREARSPSRSPIDLPDPPASEAPETIADSASAAPPPVEEKEDGKILVTGTCIQVDASGAEIPTSKMVISVTTWPGSSGGSTWLAVEDGAWSHRVRPDGQVEIGQALVEWKWAVVVAPVGRFDPDPGKPVEVRVRRPRMTVLRVVDAATDRDLDDLVLVRAERFPREDLLHPGLHGEMRVVRSGVGSPIEIPAPDDREPWSTWLIGCAGYAWGRVEVDRSVGGERRVRLASGGALEAQIAGPDRDRACVLRIHPAQANSRAPLAEVSAAERDRILLDGLPVGRHRVALEIGDWWEKPHVLAEAEVTIRAGAVELLTLNPKSLSPIELVPLRGVVIIPPAWKIDSPFIVIRLRDPPRGEGRETIYLGFRDLKARPDEPGVWDFDVGKVQPGRYLADLGKTEFVITFVVKPTGLLDLRLEAPPPGRVVVTVIDDSTGKPADLDDVTWNPRRPEPNMGGSCNPAARDPETGRFTFLAPQGEIDVDICADGFHGVGERVIVGAGPTEVTIRVRPTGGMIRLSVRDGDAVVPWDSTWKYVVEAVVGAGEIVGRSFSVSGTTLEMSEEGLYRVKFPTLAGYQSVPAREVRVSRGKTTKVVIELSRSR